MVPQREAPGVTVPNRTASKWAAAPDAARAFKGHGRRAADRRAAREASGRVSVMRPSGARAREACLLISAGFGIDARLTPLAMEKFFISR